MASLETCQQNADEVKVLMKDNVVKVMEREAKVSDLEGRSHALLTMATNFQKTAKTVERQTWRQKWRWYIVAGGTVIVLIIIIIIVIVLLSFSGE
ncbi:hypothetical protein GDO86_006633 [Hymenochirus boettgeri]|uniref:V-SNARE coiled-coil homology domain-containing protein n=1 Tax=Hymenochirus boettgeri TaxID=247094 RepID=A0A8T2JET4_9PIPI|nr:hypothetical protein GDO86_006633 [Hymenochirus boettgeri]